MDRIPQVNLRNAEGESKELFDVVSQKLGMVPNMIKVMGNSSAVLSGYLSLVHALNQGAIGSKMAEQIALTVSNINSSAYCTYAHSFISANMLNLDPVDIRMARRGKALNRKTQSALNFAAELLERRGKVSDESLRNLRQQGFTDTEITEIIAHTVLSVFTNFINNVALAEIDFPLT